MKPVSSNIIPTPEDNCTPISSNCVIWQGPDIPCLSLCKGDSITDVVYKLATMVCSISDNLLDITDLDLTCLLEGADAPTTQAELLQLLTDKICEALADDGGGGVTPPATIYTLPTCLQYDDGDDNTITQVELDEYVDLMAAAICDIYMITTNLQVDIDSLDARVTILENATPTGGSPLVSVTVQCASGPTPGASLPIQQAFYNFESKFCELSTLLGSIAQLNSFVANECPGLDTEPTLMDPLLDMQDLPNWTVTPTTVAQNLNNMWITLCDMRLKIIDCCAAAVIPCSPIAVTSLSVSSVTTSNAMVSWYVPAYGAGEAPIEYSVKVFNEVAGNPSGGAVLTQNVSHPTTFVTLSTGTLVADKSYIVQVTAIYSCGESTVAQVSSVVRISAAAQCIQVFESGLASGTVTCLSTNYPVLNKRTYARLQATVGGAPVTNTGTAITVTVSYNLVNECGATSTATATITIPNGSYEGYVDYVSATKAVCSGSGLCGDVTKTLNCVQSIAGTSTILCVAGADMCP
jgi:hypothetical protein